MQTISHSGQAVESVFAALVVPLQAEVDAVGAAHQHAANDALPFPANAIRMRDAYFDYELI